MAWSNILAIFLHNVQEFYKKACKKLLTDFINYKIKKIFIGSIPVTIKYSIFKMFFFLTNYGPRDENNWKEILLTLESVQRAIVWCSVIQCSFCFVLRRLSHIKSPSLMITGCVRDPLIRWKLSSASQKTHQMYPILEDSHKGPDPLFIYLFIGQASPLTEMCITVKYKTPTKNLNISINF